MGLSHLLNRVEVVRDRIHFLVGGLPDSAKVNNWPLTDVFLIFQTGDKRFHIVSTFMCDVIPVIFQNSSMISSAIFIYSHEFSGCTYFGISIPVCQANTPNYRLPLGVPMVKP